MGGTIRMRVGTALRKAALAAWVVAPGPAAAEDFFSGKTITLSTHSEPGGGYEVYLRLLAEHMGKHIPGPSRIYDPQSAGRRRASGRQLRRQ